MPAELGIWSRSFRVMGTGAHVLVTGPDDVRPLLEWAQQRLEQLEHRWSRFRPDSELSALNRADGKHRVVSADTRRVITDAVAAWRATGGRFDPTVASAMVASGYDRPFATFGDRGGPPTPAPARATPGCDGIRCDLSTGLVQLPAGVQLDLGGIAKGTAADLVTAELLQRGATGACVNVGGDLRVRGETPDPGGWQVHLEPPGGAPGPDAGGEPGAPTTVALRDGAVATSSTLERHWTTTDGPRHHVVDPATGRPTRSGLHSVSVVAGHAAQAEVLATTVLVAGEREGTDLIERLGLAALLVRDDGTIAAAGQLGEFVR